MTIIITDKEDDIPSEHPLLTYSVANHLMMVQTGTDMQKIKINMFCKIIIRNTDSTLSFVVCQSKRSMKNFLIFNFITDHISRPCSLLSALPSLISKMLYGGEKGDPFPLLFPWLCSDPDCFPPCLVCLLPLPVHSARCSWSCIWLLGGQAFRMFCISCPFLSFNVSNDFLLGMV